MKQRTSQILYRYWNEVRGTRLAPTRFEIEPGRITEILSETFIVEGGGEGSFKFRLAGTRMCEQLGRELRGREFLELFSGDDENVLRRSLEAVTGQGAVGIYEIEARDPAGRPVTFEVVLLPLVHTGQTISRYLGAVSAIDPPLWLGTVPLTPTGLLRHALHWPDGRPHEVIARGNQAPFLQGLASARVVRHQRRQFRVLDGGRHDASRTDGLK
jgi:hypothetical protein